MRIGNLAMPRWLAMVITAFSVVGLLGISACGNDNDDRQIVPASQAGELPPGDDMECYDRPATDQRQQVQSYLDDPNNTEQAAQLRSEASGVNTVCIIERDASGGYQQHYVSRNDSGMDASDWLMLSMMAGHSPNTALLGMAAFSDGGLSPLETIMLMNMNAVSPNGAMYHPYQRNGYGEYYRSPRVSNVYVRNVRYGSDRAISYNDSLKTAPPAKYAPAKTAVLPKADPTTVGKVTKDEKGRPKVETLKVSSDKAPSISNPLKGKDPAAIAKPATSGRQADDRAAKAKTSQPTAKRKPACKIVNGKTVCK